MALRFASLSALVNSRVNVSATARNRFPQRSFGRMMLAAVAVGVLTLPAHAQVNPTPNTFSTVAGGYTGGAYTVGAVCGGAASGSKYTATDPQGDGCPAAQAILGPNLSGIGVDGAGNIFVNDYSNDQVRKIDAKSGIVSRIIGLPDTNCSATTSATGTKQDGIGSGCVNSSATGPGTARGMNVDPWGNVILGSYNANEVNVVCLQTSPLCPGTANRKQVGSFYRIAGCVAAQGNTATAASGTTAYSSGDNSLASPFQNLSGDVAAWGLTGAAATAATVGTAGTCSATSGAVNQARNAQADKYGNVYIAETAGDRYRVVLGPATYNGVTNPLFAIINMNPKYTANEGFIYTILGAFTTFTQSSVTYNVPTASGQACSSASTTILSTDAFGDGCAYFETGKPAASSVAGIGVDKDGNPIFSDNADSIVRVLYVGGTTMAQIISVTNGGITPVVGTVYAIEGTGTASKGATPQLNVSSGSISSGNTKVAVDGQDNIYLSDGTGINIIDSTTGYLRRPISTGGTACATGVNGNGDGCPTGQGTSWTSLSSVGTAIAVDNLGNLLLADSTGRVRKILAGTLYPTAVGSTFTQNVVLHEPAGTTGITATLLNAAPGISIPATAPACTLYNSASDNTADCTVVVTFAPTVAGKVGAILSATNVGANGNTTLYQLIGQATDAALVTDVAAPNTSTVATFGATGIPTSLAIDTGGNLYTIDNNAGTVVQISAAGTVTSIGPAPSAANQIAVDPSGTIIVTSTGRSMVRLYFPLAGTASYGVADVSIPGVAMPQGVAFDAQRNKYFSDATTASVYEVPNNTGFASLQGPVALATGLANPTLLAFDGLGNLLIADTGIVYRVNASTGALATVASASAGGTVLTALTPIGIAGDAGGNVYIQDSASKSIFEIPYQTFAPGAVTVLTGETTPSGLAVDGRGQIYAADSGLSTPAVIKVSRASETYTFPTGTTTFNGTFTNTGNINSTGYAETDTAEFPYTSGSSGGCGSITGTSPLLAGAACTFSVTPNLGGNGQLVTNTTTLLPAVSIGSLVLTAQEPTGVTYATTTTVTGPSSAVFTSTGTEIIFTVAESSTNNNSQNGENVTVTIDSGSPVAYVLSGGTASVPVSGLSSGPHTITAVYAGDGTYLTSMGSATFTINQATTTVTWNPNVTTQQFSAAIGAGVLDATAAAAGVNAPGSFIYTATPAGGPPVFVHSASYLPIGTYSLGVTFVPNDALDYAQSTATIGAYTVTKATTTAPVGTTQMLVAADGTGNYSSVQAAVNALPSGGSIYIKPGTYNGSITVVQPGISFRGLGGDPTQVVLTHSGGAFNNGQVQNQFAGEFNSSQSNGYQLPAGSTLFTGDEASATLVVAKGVNTALSTATQIPNNFYGENFSLINTYNTDTTTTTNVYTAGGATPCVVNSGAARTYSDLFNNGLQCASQALTIWTTSDLSVMNNIYTTSLQDTIYTASQGSGSNGYVPARQYWFRGKVTGNIDFIFGDAAAVFDSTSIYTAWHGNTATGTETVHAQNKMVQTGAAGDYLSGYIMNNDVFTSQSTGMTSLYFGRPYGTYSTWIMLNSYVDQVNPTGYTTGLGPTLTPTTFTEYNDMTYTDPATGSPDRNGIPYLGTGGNSGSGVSGPREASSTNPGTPMANDAPPTSMTQAQAQAYFPTNFLSQTVPLAVSSTQNWNPTAAIAAAANTFIPLNVTTATIAGGSSVTILMRPQTPGLGAITNGVYTLPTGTYTLTDSFNGGTATTIASGTLDASGEAYFISSSLTVGTHNLSWTYSGDANFSGSSTASAYVLTVTGTTPATTTTSVAVTTSPITYGQSASVVATVSATAGTPTGGTVTLTIDAAATQTAPLTNGVANFSVSGLTTGVHMFSASYNGGAEFLSSASTANASVTVNKATLIATGVCATRLFDQQPNVCSSQISGLQNGDTQAAVVSTLPSGATTAVGTSPAGSYPVTASGGTLTAFGAANYTLTYAVGSFTITGGVPQAIIFATLPNFVSGATTYQLTARTTSGLPVSYTVTAGTASVTGSTLTVGAPGPVTIQASTPADPTGDYAPATPVSRSFTAQ